MPSLLLWMFLAAADGGTTTGSFDASAPLRLGPAEARAEKAITAAELARHVRYLASDALEGRAPGTRGDLLAQQYIAGELEKLGFRPGAPDGGYLQPVELVGTTGNAEQVTVSFADGGTSTLRHLTDVVAVAGTPKPQSKLEGAELVFVGYGIQAPEFGWDDFKGVDLTGKVLLVLNSDPANDPELFAGPARLWYGRWDYKFEMAGKVGAAGVVLLHTRASAGYPWRVVQTSWTGEQFDLPDRTAPQTEVEMWWTEEATRKVLSTAGYELDALVNLAQLRGFKPLPLGVKVSTSFSNEVNRRTTANVIAVLPGSDPALAAEAVLYTAHHDHIGKKRNAKKGEDAIYNGALDNASGVAQVLAVAKAYAALPQPPRRSIYVAAVAAEEQGLLGSEYLARNPPLPLGRIAAVLNMDGANIWGRTRDVTVIGHGKSADLDALVTRVAKLQGRVVTPDQMPDRGFFYRSDQFSFAKRGVPAVYAESGLDVRGKPKGWGKAQKEAFEARHYHQPSDEFVPGRWNLSGAVEDARLYFHVGRLLSNGDDSPAWTPGDEFEDERRRSQDAAGGR